MEEFEDSNNFGPGDNDVSENGQMPQVSDKNTWTV